MSKSRISCALIFISIASSLQADGPADNQAASVRPVPPPGIAISDEVRSNLKTELATLQSQISELRKSKNPDTQRYLPDVEIFARAVELALNEDGFFEPKDAERAKQVLQEGLKRAASVKQGFLMIEDQMQTVRGFRSRLDGTVQPYGVVMSKATDIKKSPRTDIWCRGRAEKGLELQFIATRMTNSDPAPEPGTIMIHPFGRYCNANKLAGEVDTLEVLEHAIKEYQLDPKRVVIRGFSMGGAAAWHLAVHYPDKWLAANPGAGFSETPLFLKVFQSEELKPTWFEQKLWQMYDCPVWARNLRMLPTIAYSGEIDKQKQAADVMADACWNLPASERFELTHIVAPKTAHKVDPVARTEIERRLAILDKNHSPKLPRQISFTTTTLKYNRAHWVTINALREHWVPAIVTAEMTNSNNINLTVENITDLSLDLDANSIPSDVMWLSVDLQGKKFHCARRSDLSWGMRLRKFGSNWEQVSPIEPPAKELVKKHSLQGPIDDAFMGPFLFVKPTAAGNHPKVDQWVESEFNRAVREWHRQMRGDAIVKTSDELKQEDIENYHLVLWGDSKSNPTLAKIVDKLPIQWNQENISVGAVKYAASTHLPVMIFPNPLNPDRYVVLNSSFTYREYDYLNNARQIPKLPDWAIVDITTPPDSRFPGKIADADFFDEKWALKPSRTPAAK